MKSHAPKTRRNWTPEELDHLSNCYKDYTAVELTKIFGRPIASIRGQLKLMQLVKMPNNPWSKEEVHQLKLLFAQYPISVLQKKLNRNKHSILNWFRRNSWSKRASKFYAANQLKQDENNRKAEISRRLAQSNRTEFQDYC